MRRVNVHLEEQQLEGLRKLKQRTSVLVNTLVRGAVASMLADTEKHGIPAIVLDTQSNDAESSHSIEGPTQERPYLSEQDFGGCAPNRPGQKHS